MLPARADLSLSQHNNRSTEGETKIPAGGVGNLVKESTSDPFGSGGFNNCGNNARAKTQQRHQNQSNGR